ncbi:zinc finger protein [Macleaya cordata]|uniref:Zinc finger protein n=1 Tax=Macleaya cordata TaxID=56857 RepID=A0A200QBU0_MACCD|nr:zinc finger protein [Macleaya cordata]
MISGTNKKPNRMFLKCQFVGCGSFQRLDDAIKESHGAVGSSSSPKQHRSLGCFGCGENDHWRNKCPWVGSPCREDGCSGTREMKVSKWDSHQGSKYLGCTKCNDKQWFSEAKKLKENPPPTIPTVAQIVIQTTLEDLCSKLKGDLSLEK